MIREVDSPALVHQPVEVVERKGIGHPDTICDGVAEAVSRALCRYERERFGEILHHNVDKVLLVAGAARPELGGGEVIEPLEIHVAGRATGRVGDERVPVDAIAQEACRAWLGRHLRYLDPGRDVRVVPRIRPGSAALTSVFGRGRALANDTSCGVGFAPRTPLERAVLAVDRALAAPKTRREHPAFGEDVKIMATRVGERVALTVGCAMMARYIPTRAGYEEAARAARRIARRAAETQWTGPVEVAVNAADDLACGDMYLTVTGTSAEAGDDGEAGRGNSPTGLITPYRPTSPEAVAGKNPVTHVGKLYNLAAGRIAAALTEDVEEIAEASCVLVSRIGHPIEDPPLADVRLGLDAGRLDARLRDRADAIVRHHLDQFGDLQEDLVAGRIDLY